MTKVAAIAILIAVGQGTKYDEGVFERVLENRGNWGQVPSNTDPAKCVAVIGAEYIGREVIIETSDGRLFEGIVCDCAAKGDIANLRMRNWAIDLSPELAGEILPDNDIKVFLKQ
jgi:hypothetical protein